MKIQRTEVYFNKINCNESYLNFMSLNNSVEMNLLSFLKRVSISKSLWVSAVFIIKTQPHTKGKEETIDALNEMFPFVHIILFKAVSFVMSLSIPQ